MKVSVGEDDRSAQGRPGRVVPGPSRERGPMIDGTTLVFAGLATVGFVALTLRVGVGTAVDGFRQGVVLLLELLPRLAAAFLLAGIMQALIPRDLVAHWLSEDAGPRAILLASVLGVITPGGPFLQFPVLATVYRMGAGVAPVVAYLTAWSLMGVHRVLLWELPFLGPRLTVVRLTLSLPIPFVVGLATRWVLQWR